jgi:hypothetical protein
MCTCRCVPVGASKALIATPMNGYATGSQNSADPRTPQNPRRAFVDE